jgi:hypothetical protein
MPSYSHCLECNRQLRDAVFCLRCGQSLCSWKCLGQHEGRHENARPQEPTKAEAQNQPPPHGPALKTPRL